MKTIHAYFREYEKYHRTFGNKVCHIIGITLIVMSTLGLLDEIILWRWSLPVHASAAWVALLLVNAFYIKLHLKLGLSMVVSTVTLYFIGIELIVSALWILFVLGWVFQYLGHYVFEKKAPAFMQNLIHMLIGPVFIQNYFLRMV